MRRLVLALLAIVVIVAGAVFFADNPGAVEIDWQGWRVDTSVGVLIAAAVLAMLVLAGLIRLLAAVVRGPRRWRRRRHERRRRNGYQALTRGMVAVAAGDVGEARRHARKADALLAEPPLTLLLSAQVAQLEGDENAAAKFFTAMLDRSETEFLGLRGLINQARRSGDGQAALALVERAQRLRPATPWVVESLLDLQARAGRWSEARQTLDEARRRRVVGFERARHHQGVVLYELSRIAERAGERRRAVGLAAKAQALLPDLAPPAVHHARLLTGMGRRRAATKAIERAWRAAPHPELATYYAGLDPDAAPLARMRAVTGLVGQRPDTLASHLAAATIALDARLWGEARLHLERAQAVIGGGVIPELCRLMAQLEEAEHGAGDRARDWLRRAVGAPPDPCYVCGTCGGESGAWQSLCPHCGAFDTLAWRTPNRGVVAPASPVLAAEPAAAPATVIAPAEPLGGGGTMR